MAIDKIKRKQANYITLGARFSALFLLPFIIFAYFFPISKIFHFTSSDLLMHFIGFLMLGFILALSIPRDKTIWILLSIILLGIALEIGQHFLTVQRELSLLDMASNISGGVIGFGLVALILWTNSRLQHSHKA